MIDIFKKMLFLASANVLGISFRNDIYQNVDSKLSLLLRHQFRFHMMALVLKTCSVLKKFKNFLSFLFNFMHTL